MTMTGCCGISTPGKSAANTSKTFVSSADFGLTCLPEITTMIPGFLSLQRTKMNLFNSILRPVPVLALAAILFCNLAIAQPDQDKGNKHSKDNGQGGKSNSS